MNAQVQTIDHEPQEASQALAPRPETPMPAARTLTPMDMLNRAVESGAGLEMVQKLMDLQERWEANEARKAFTQAFAAFKSEAIAIYRNKKVTDGPLNGKSYAELSSFVDAVTPALSKHGLSASWDITRDEEKWIEVSCTIEHELGHSKKPVKIGGPPDVGGAKNPIQARISTISYLERATFKAACGVAEKGDDRDGKTDKADEGPITKEQVDQLLALIERVGAATEKFCGVYQIEAVPQLPAKLFKDAVENLETYGRRNKK